MESYISLLEQERNLQTLAQDGIQAAQTSLSQVRKKIISHLNRFKKNNSNFVTLIPGYSEKMISVLLKNVQTGSVTSERILRDYANRLIVQKMNSPHQVPYSNTGTYSHV